MKEIKDMYLNNHNRPKKKLKQLKGIVIHYTANTNEGANAAANRNYFNSTTAAVSAHYIVDDNQIIRCVPDDEVAYHVGAKKYTEIGQRIREAGFTPNYYLIGIEMCVNSDGDWHQTYKNTVELVAYLLRVHKLTMGDVYRHFDITGKQCPKMFVENGNWTFFRLDVMQELRNIKLMYNNQYIDTDIQIIDGKVYAPVRDVLEGMGHNIMWHQDTKHITID